MTPNKPASEEKLASAISSLTASMDRLAEAFASQGTTSGRVYPTMEPLAAQTLAEAIKYLGDMIRPLETHTLAGAVKDLAETLRKQ